MATTSVEDLEVFKLAHALVLKVVLGWAAVCPAQSSTALWWSTRRPPQINLDRPHDE